MKKLIENYEEKRNREAVTVKRENPEALTLPALEPQPGSSTSHVVSNPETTKPQEPEIKRPKLSMDEKKNDFMGTFFGDLTITKVEGPKPLQERIEQEVVAYLSVDHIDARSDVLAWWKIHAIKFPLVANIARQILCVPATSTPSERAFSKAGSLITKKRAQLKPNKVDMILFLNKNMKV